MRHRAWPLPAYYFALLALLYLPLAILLLFAFNSGTILVFPLKGLTLRWFGQLWATEALMRSLRNSLMVAAGSSIVATILATCGAIAFVRFRFKGKGLFITVALLPLYVPFVVLGVSLLLLFSTLGIPRSLLTIGAAHSVVSLPYALLIVTARLVGSDPHLEEAAMSLGADNWQTLRRGILPLIAPAIVAAWPTAFTVSFDEFAIANLLVGREPTLPVYLYSQLRMTARLPLVVAMAALVMVGTLSIFLALVWLRRILARTPASAAGATSALTRPHDRHSPAGEFFSLLGPSGCGKTTTLRIVAGFEMPSAGSVFLNGVEITARPAHMREIGMVFQHYALFPHLSVFENIAFPLRLRRTDAGEIQQRVSQALEMVRLPGLAGRMPAQLSGGQQQRVALARALVFHPSVVLLDEPLGALDLKLRKAMVSRRPLSLAVAGWSGRGDRRTGAGLERAARGVIRDLIYTGSDTQYFVELGPPGVVMVRIPNDTPPEGRPHAGPGQRVWVRWQVGSTAVLLA